MDSLEGAKRLKFMVVGTGRSGSAFTAHVLTLLGVPCGHEDVFNARLACGESSLVGDSNHQSAPYLKKLEDEGCLPIIFHQLRDPVGYVKSLCGEVWLPNPSGNERYMMSHVSVDKADRIKAAMQMWVGWNDLIVPHSTLEYRVEDLNAGKMVDILEILGVRRDVAEIEAALEQGRRNSHAKPKEATDKEVRENPYFPYLKERALDYGYVL